MQKQDEFLLRKYIIFFENSPQFSKRKMNSIYRSEQIKKKSTKVKKRKHNFPLPLLVQKEKLMYSRESGNDKNGFKKDV